ncbi:hypothetical protein JIN85_14785 [Luteolibacter pohnpeiensis]|uniref:Uncharacterized protein n=1 Tax=Luteolibacter pohnpeiensis TaxID=454153 RepID=A0A934SA55_9BACT|nr:hypothetical protein [Luteolibacter pohnpeiensis]MBK1883681.1 hypothetical protein [Luteolibacter pohnpeiensis]
MSDIEKVECTVVGESDLAYQLRDKASESRVAWFPKSQVSFARRNRTTGESLAEIPLWLLNQKGWNA